MRCSLFPNLHKGGPARHSEKILNTVENSDALVKDFGPGMTIDWVPCFTTKILQVDISGDYADSFLLFVVDAWLRFGEAGPKVLQQL